LTALSKSATVSILLSRMNVLTSFSNLCATYNSENSPVFRATLRIFSDCSFARSTRRATDASAPDVLDLACQIVRSSYTILNDGKADMATGLLSR
jgi:hypothetical protein